MCRCFPLHTKSLVFALTTSVTQSRFTLKRSAGDPVFHSWVLHTAASELARRGSASKKPTWKNYLTMSRVRSSVSALIARQPALIAQAVTSSNLTQAVSPCVRCVPHDPLFCLVFLITSLLCNLVDRLLAALLPLLTCRYNGTEQR
ncbi:Hypothetical predicted protein [Scomber scombrus]|uniref:Secreted protein n=1 Tax=Scomber scombrus TaxID=13677 RepID=A0AAV1NI73_SCOSC